MLPTKNDRKTVWIDENLTKHRTPSGLPAWCGGVCHEGVCAASIWGGGGCGWHVGSAACGWVVSSFWIWGHRHLNRLSGDSGAELCILNSFHPPFSPLFFSPSLPFSFLPDLSLFLATFFLSLSTAIEIVPK
ncbi:hypothetical protein GOODEAATRI_007157 [Goodea atripinnis]|uniref:Uncharacterized protein n=1 Tax=Goodea atripinnis TaxID=208336 RepID=A0ABV0MPZ0_9TELE